MRNLVGEYAHKMDAKGRVSLPANFRKAIAEDATLVVAPSLDEQFLKVYLKTDYIAWVTDLFDKSFGGYDPTDPDHVAQYSFLMGAARDCEIDATGRIMVCSEQRAVAGLSTQVSLVGCGDCIEVWDTARREEFNAKQRAVRASFFQRSKKAEA